MKKILLYILIGGASSVISADVIYSNNSSGFESQFNYPLIDSSIEIYSKDQFNQETGRLEFKEPSVNVFSKKNFEREIYAKVNNKLLSDKLTLTIYNDERTGDIKEIESKTIPKIDRMLDWGAKLVKFVITLGPILVPLAPNEPEYTLSEDDVKLSEAQCIKYKGNILINIPRDLSSEGRTVEIEGNNGKKCIEITYKPISAYSIPFEDLKVKNVGNNLLSSVCREVEITVHQTDSKKYNYTTTVVDSSFLSRSQIPENGILIPKNCYWSIKK